MRYVNSKKKPILVAILALIFIVAVTFTYYVSDYYHADNKALAALKSTDTYTVSDTV